jgi:DNA-binding NtrC family response regulator
MTFSPILPWASGGVLVASPNPSLREQVLHSFQERRRPVQEVLGGAEALVKLETGNWQILYLDRRLRDLDAEELIQIIRRRFPGIEVVMVDSDTGSTNDMASKSCVSAAANSEINSQAAKTGEEEPSLPQAEVEPLPGMIGRAESMRHLYRMARLVAGRATTVLITGPTGTGKELVARAIHQLSPRCSRPFVVVNCAAIPETLLESELFGHVRGSFTGAVQNWNGRIQSAQGGTLFLDEIGDMPLGLQSKLLRFLDQKEIQRLGSSESLHVDVRVVAATNADLEQRVEQGSFRRDLFYRLSAFPLELPRLSDRGGDIPDLAEYFLKRMMANGRSPAPTLSREGVQILESRRWDGNVRELEQVMERAAILAEGASIILPQHLSFSTGRTREAARKMAG